MLDELRAAALLDGWRGSPAIDRDTLAGVIAAYSTLLDRYSELSEFEINPLRVYPDGVLALDALAVVDG